MSEQYVTSKVGSDFRIASGQGAEKARATRTGFTGLARLPRASNQRPF
ncbi:MAG: hypothetical protein NW224_16645 [Leptolyngbyaceae cyanobacterium bins.302]|nr:hypothetical protein [Leptolyngbyaceae cyanobacterium bins.302]